MPVMVTVLPVPTFWLAKVAEMSEKVTLSPASTPPLASVAASMTVPSYTLLAPVPFTVIASGVMLAVVVAVVLFNV